MLNEAFIKSFCHVCAYVFEYACMNMSASTGGRLCGWTHMPYEKKCSCLPNQFCEDNKNLDNGSHFVSAEQLY